MLFPRYLARPVLRGLTDTSTSIFGCCKSNILCSQGNHYRFSQFKIQKSIKQAYQYSQWNKEQQKDTKKRTRLPQNWWLIVIREFWGQQFEANARNVRRWLWQFGKQHTYKLFKKVFAGGLAIFAFLTQFLGYNFISSYLQKRYYQRKQNIQTQNMQKMIKLLQQMHQEQEKHIKEIQNELQTFQFQNFSYRKDLEFLMNIDDSKLTVYIQSFIGSSVATNLKRLAWNFSERKGQYDQQTINIGSLTFFKGFISNNQQVLKESAIHSANKQEYEDWGVAKDLNYLLTSIIRTGKYKGKNKYKSILIIDEAQLLQTFLNDQGKKEKLQELYQKIYHVQRNQGVRIFLIGNSHSFFHRFTRQLEGPKLEDFKYKLIERMTEDDIRNIIKYRSKIDNFYQDKTQLKQFKGYFDLIIEYLVDTTDNAREILRIIKQGKIDFKQHMQKKQFQIAFIDQFKGHITSQQKVITSLQNIFPSKQTVMKEKYDKELQKQQEKIYLKQNQSEQDLKTTKEQKTDQEKKQQKRNHYLALKEIKKIIYNMSEEFVDQKKRAIHHQIFQVSHQMEIGSEKILKQDMIKSKMKVLLFIFSKKQATNNSQTSEKPAQSSSTSAASTDSSTSAKQESDEEFLCNMTMSQALAYEQLNKAEIIHGLSFSSKAYERAFYYILKEEKDKLSKLKLKNYAGQFQKIEKFASHKTRVQSFEKDVREMQKKFNKQLVV